MDNNQRSRRQKSANGSPAQGPRRGLGSRIGLEKRGAPAPEQPTARQQAARPRQNAQRPPRPSQQINPQKPGYRPGAPQKQRRVTQAEIIRRRNRRRALGILGVLAVIAGSVIVFLAARALGRNAVQRFLDKGVMEKYLPIIEEKQDMFLFLTMLFPFFPDDALCMLAGLTKIPLGRFVAIMALARPWGLVVAALLGSGSLSLPVWAWAVIGGAGLLIFVFAMKYSAQIEEALLGLVRRIVPKRNRSDRN